MPTSIKINELSSRGAIGVISAVLLAIGVTMSCSGFVPVGVPFAVIGGLMLVGAIVPTFCNA